MVNRISAVCRCFHWQVAATPAPTHQVSTMGNVISIASIASWAANWLWTAADSGRHLTEKQVRKISI
jgi:hypothetical protein